MTTETANKPQADPAEILRALGVLFQPGDVAELRAFYTGRTCTVSGYYNDPKRLAADAIKANRFGNAYVVLNAIDPALLARRANRLEERPRTTTNDDQVTRRRWLPIDLDPVRPAGISASDSEHEAAIQRGREVCRFLVTTLGWPEPIVADSGNGCHILPRIDLPNVKESTEIVRRCLQALSLRFSDDRVKVDTGMFNASRIWKLYGTVARKGDSTEDRPHRIARLLYIPNGK